MFLGLDLKTWLGLTVVGSVVSTLGALFGIFLKDYFFSRSFERWKQRQTLELLYQKYRDPLMLSARELASRTVEIVDNYPTVFLKATVLASRPERQLDNSIKDPYFQRYKLVSTAYRFCALLGWLELYRQEITYLHSGRSKHSKDLERAIGLIRGGPGGWPAKPGGELARMARHTDFSRGIARDWRIDDRSSRGNKDDRGIWSLHRALRL